ITADIKPSSVELSMLAIMGTRGVLGRSATGGNPDIINTTNDGYILSYDSATPSISFKQLVTAGVTNNAITYAKMQQMNGLSVLGNDSNSTGNMAAITAGSDGLVLRRSGTSLA